MNSKEMYQIIANSIKNQKDVNIEVSINETIYDVCFNSSMPDKGINMPSIIAIPKSKRINNQIILESNNLETDNLERLLEQASETGKSLARLTSDFPAPIIIPILPSFRSGPYFQQLSRECFELDSNNPNYRIDKQIVRLINVTKEYLLNKYGIKAEDKILLNGYSSSGVFAQRFTFIHPELVDTACIGGASGSIPLPSDKIGYPIGIKDYDQLFGKSFDFKNYSKIKFRYYVGELETSRKSEDRYEEHGNPAPMHDMSYFDRSVPKEVGKIQRRTLGIELLSRAEKTVDYLRKNGINILHTVIPVRHHNNAIGIGVNELGEKYIKDTYLETLKSHDIESR